MSVYVDPMVNWGTSVTWRYHSNCHMYADTLKELHRMASAIGLKRTWFQDKPNFPHYDLTESKRLKAVRAGAVEVGRDEMVAYVRSRRDQGAVEAVNHGYRCQFCGKDAPAANWKDDRCPHCGKAYDPILAQEEDDD